MASVTNSKDQAEKSQVEKPDDADAIVEFEPSSTGSGGGGGGAVASGSGFFHIYKKGQGYWTRMGTAIGIGIIAAFTAYNIFIYVPTFLPAAMDEATARKIGIAAALAFLASFCLLGYWLMNKPGNADFLIATDSEMKKVNWTSRRELIGSTKVVILFMFTVTVFLFLVDILFGYLFYLIGVLKNGPFGGVGGS